MSEKTNKSASTNIWDKADVLFQRSVRARKGVNLDKLSKTTKDGQVVIVADKILAKGTLTHKLTIVAMGFSKSAKEQILSAGGKIMQMDELKKSHPNAEGVVLLG